MSEKRLVRARGQALRSPNTGAHGASAGRALPRFALTHRLFFRAGAGTISKFARLTTLNSLARIDLFAFTVRSPAWETVSIIFRVMSEKRLVRARGQALRSPNTRAHGASAGRALPRFALTHRLFFRAGAGTISKFARLTTLNS